MQYLSFCVWFVSLNMVSSGSNPFCCKRQDFILVFKSNMNNIPLSIMFSLSRHLMLHSIILYFGYCEQYSYKYDGISISDTINSNDSL